MGYLLTAGVNLTDEEWRGIVRMAAERGAARPDLDLGRNEKALLQPVEARAIARALEADLDDEMAPLRAVDKDAIEGIISVLRSGLEVQLVRTPPWKSGD